MLVGVAISTRNRRDVFIDSLAKWIEHTPHHIPIIVVDDASDEPVILQSYRKIPFHTRNVRVVRHEYRRGIAMTKNRGIAELVDLGVEHLFLADDDVYPMSDAWWKPYVESDQPHLQHQWVENGPTVVHRDDEHLATAWPRGVLYYMTREIVETVGGMDPSHGVWGGEHVEYTWRIHNAIEHKCVHNAKYPTRGKAGCPAALTRWPICDVAGSERLWRALDKKGNIAGTFDLAERRRMTKAAGVAWGKSRSVFVPYREDEGVQDFQLGPRISDKDFYATLQHVLALRPSGTALEFGVYQGTTLNMIAKHMPVIGFDAWRGLPEKWRDGFDKGMFACRPPVVPDNARFVAGWFDETLPLINLDAIGHIGLVHIDCDLYSSTVTILEHVGPYLQPGTFVVFDEYHGYPQIDGVAQGGEERAWREFAAKCPKLGWTVVGHGPEQYAIRITSGIA